MGSKISHIYYEILYQAPPVGYMVSDNPTASSPYFLVYTKNGHIGAFFIDVGSEYTILFSHANGEDNSCTYRFLKRLARTINMNICGYDYSGYGRSSGHTSEEEIYANVDAMYSWLQSEKQINYTHIILWGRSIGGCPSIYLASRLSKAGTPPRGLVLQCSFLSIFRFHWNYRFTTKSDSFNNLDKIKYVECPVTIIHGIDDCLVPIWHAKRMWQNINPEYRWKFNEVPKAGHNNIEYVMKQNFGETIKEFVDSTGEIYNKILTKKGLNPKELQVKS